MYNGDAGGMETAMKLNLTREAFERIAKEHTKPLIIPLCTKMAGNFPPVKECGFILESLDRERRDARHSVMGMEPVLTITIGETLSLTGDEQYVACARRAAAGETPVETIRSIVDAFTIHAENTPEFTGCFAGYFAYDLIYSLFNKISGRQKNGKPVKRDQPVARFMLTQESIVTDHDTNETHLFSYPLITEDSDPKEEYENAVRRMQTILCTPEAAEETKSDNGTGEIRPTSNIAQDTFEERVAQTREYVHAGEILQAVISRRMECAYTAPPIALYSALRYVNPSNYMYFIDFGVQQIIGSSPEMLVRVEGRTVTTVPIAGTRPRGRNGEEDIELARDLLADKKECAEHLMLVDLARNDLGRVCRYGSVVPETFMKVEKFSHVQHIVSRVSGELRDDCDRFDAFTSCFPAGTVSGAPKIRAMQIIDELEDDPRGIYAGAVGYIGLNGDLNLAIAIRTVIIEDGKASVQAGAGIVADSVPKKEYEETGMKAGAMLAAIRMAEEGV
ncbi:anthranilate synthase component I family protein [Methanogenium organophilum]|uniref:anthranilate synthase n=1 Tax=Methanogenium organophilum TaxID=2199 RepID=A0A9X9S5E6_METOG|nr:anthranilate synthase component I family protein [Methanogenium organophilum]WAI02042.1 anthranilate synthase component I family protein [Methanogenium organophilum]